MSVEIYYLIIILLCIIVSALMFNWEDIKEYFKSFVPKIKKVVCTHEYRQFGHKLGDPLDPNNPWVFCDKCGKPGLIDDKFWNSN